MKLTVITRLNKYRSVVVPKGDPIPTIVHPEGWIGQGAGVDLGETPRLDVLIQGLHERRYLAEVGGLERWREFGDDYGVELLWLYPARTDEAKEAFLQAFLRFWLSYVFGQEIEFEYVEEALLDDVD